MKNLFKVLTVAGLSGISNLCAAQPEAEMADAMRADGKIYVVVAIITIILGGILTYLVLIDRKISRLEKRAAEKK